MIKNILQLLEFSTFYGISENVEIAKGKYELTKTFKATLKQKARKLQYKLDRNG